MTTYKMLPFRIEESQHRMLRKMAFLNEVSMAQLLREMIDRTINEHKKVLTNSDIVI